MDPFTESLVTSLLQNTQFDISGGMLGLPVLTGPALKTALAPVASVLDGVVSEILQAAGISLGEADVAVHGIRCGGPRLTG